MDPNHGIANSRFIYLMLRALYRIELNIDATPRELDLKFDATLQQVRGAFSGLGGCPDHRLVRFVVSGGIPLRVSSAALVENIVIIPTKPGGSSRSSLTLELLGRFSSIGLGKPKAFGEIAWDSLGAKNDHGYAVGVMAAVRSESRTVGLGQALLNVARDIKRENVRIMHLPFWCHDEEIESFAAGLALYQRQLGERLKVQATTEEEFGDPPWVICHIPEDRLDQAIRCRRAYWTLIGIDPRDEGWDPWVS